MKPIKWTSRSRAATAILLAVLSIAYGPQVDGQPTGEPTPADLPATELAREWLARDAEVVAAEARRDASRHEAQQLRASSNEWSVSYSWQNRSYENTSGSDSREWVGQLERAVRLPNKYFIDRRLADNALELGEAQHGEALHESARTLVDMWLEWQEVLELEQLFDAQIAVAEQNLSSVAARLRNGDAARLDLNLAEADVADVRRRRSEAGAAKLRAELGFNARFSGNLPLNPQRIEPMPVPGTLESWRTRIRAQSDELRIMELEAQRAQEQVSRARADQLPDPSIGLYTSSEVFDSEKVTGISLTIPVPGRYRVARAAQARQVARVAEAQLAGLQRELDARISATFAEAQSSYDRWLLAQTAAEKANDSAALTRRAYQLGEAEIQSLLIARRQALDASVVAVEARIDARRASHHLLVDGHLIWDLDHE